ncbi:ATP-binding protein [Microtetraspora malaysiensis]|uniref:ATP-binding protein n=1 Tax=Microtetraspora malaysiensis TaxID=161358 RepID=A0ABW6SV03_9ACTN
MGVVHGFIGRQRELARLHRWLGKTAAGGAIGRPGRALLLRGRRRVGKSRLVEEFVERSGVPHLFFTASGRPMGEELRLFAAEAAASTLPGASLFDSVTLESWEAAMRLLAAALPQDGPGIVVLDELPYLIAGDPGFEGTLQKVFDRELSRMPVLLIGIGSDLSMMEALNDYGRPFHQRATEMVLSALDPADVGEMLGLGAADAFDAYLVSGGLPLICDEWPSGASLWDYLAEAVTDPTSALVVSGERSLAGEFPPEAQSRVVLNAIGTGQRTFGSIGRAAAGVSHATLSRALQLLLEKRLVTAELPLSSRPSRETRYHVADVHLRFWLAFIWPGLPEIERGRGDRVLHRIRASWTSWRGLAIEPTVRESLRRMPEGTLPTGTNAVGGYWTRTNDPEIDLVGGDREPISKKITMVGSVKWLEDRPFDSHDLAELVVHRAKLPGADSGVPMFAVSRSGSATSGVTVVGPEELLHAWRS